ncbi:DUF3367 domain-containing protein [Micromonospora radicis]|uniref:DUF3367 domain-containing protein n=1 Tax=Micromonospora radicis TaxID=1894971 RepID=A0A418MNH5_9ACTN|nr:alpha-(1->3)-arabinofuranosyltransferase family protein [Micromonospora radicis]RIV32597.1 DUF3367 domain-containing protein [Micromonospora radicis]
MLTTWPTVRRERRTPPVAVQSAVWRMREVLVCLALTGFCVTQDPGLLVADTKLDMAVDPGAFLARATELWTAGWQFGSLQNQAIGYFFPMGPFFLLGEAVGLPMWFVQRLWMAALLCTAFLGVVRLARALDLGGPASRVIGGLIFALSPRALSLVGTVSLELLPYCVAPWVVLPLVRGAAGGSLRRAAALSGLAVVCMGGANGAATASAVLPALLYVLTRPPRRRWRLFAWWTAAMVAATCWWLVPLLLMQQYGFPFLPYTESAAVTTAVTDLGTTLRGASHWLGYLAVDGVPWWRSGWALATAPWLAVVTGFIACVGLAGLARRDLPERRFLVVGALVGLLILTAGNMSNGGALFAATVREALDGPLAALRNLHKFDVVLRMPLALAAAHLLHGAARISAVRRFARPVEMAPRRAALGVTAVALVAVAGGAGTAGLAAGGGYPALPEHWRQAAGWLDRHAGHGSTLLVPGSNFAEYDWGRPMDEPLQPLLKSRWAVRSLVPAGSVGNARLLSAIDERLASGVVSPGLADVLGRLGVRYLVVRNDLRPPVGARAWPVLVHRTLDSAPGLTRVAHFGPIVGREPDLGSAWDYGLHRPYPAVEIYRVDRPAPRAVVVDAAEPLDLVGAPETLLDLADAGILGDRPVIIDGDAGVRDRTRVRTVLADSLRSREVDFGLVRGNVSRTFGHDDRPRQSRAAHDLFDPAWESSLTWAGYTGVADVRASSSAADVAGPAGLRDPSATPFAAVDGDSGTAWLSDGADKPVGQWLEVRFPRQIRPQSVELQVVHEELIAEPVTRVRVSTAGGSRVHQVTGAGAAPVRLALPAGATDWLRVTVDAVAELDVPGRRAGIRELRIADVTPVRYLRLPAPADPSGAPDAVALARRSGDRSACTTAGDHYLCSPELTRHGEETGLLPRRFESPAAFTADLTGLARAVPATALAEYDEVVGEPDVVTSSTWFADPVASSRSLRDGDDGTAWWADPDDPQPTLELRWDKKRKVGWVRLRFSAGLVAAPPLTVRVTGDDGIREAKVGLDGVARFAPLRTRNLVVAVTSTVPRVNRSTALFEPWPLPLGISEIDVEGAQAEPPPDLDRTVTLPCGAGPTIVVNGRQVPTTAVGTLRDLRDLRPLRYRACAAEPDDDGTGSGRVVLRRGTNEVSAAADRFVVDSVILANRTLANSATGRAGGEPVPRALAVLDWDDRQRSLSIGPGADTYLIVTENANPGWTATLDGVALFPARIDGWKQAWFVPAGTAGRIELVFEPGAHYQLVLRVAGVLLLVLVVAAVVPARRDRPAYPVIATTMPTAPLLAVGVPVLLGGLAGLGSALLVVVLNRRRAPAPVWVWLPGSIGLMGEAARRWWLPPPVAELLVLVPTVLLLVAVAALVLRGRRVPGRYEKRRPSRLSGWLRRPVGRARRFRRAGQRPALDTAVQQPDRAFDEVVAGGRDRDGERQGDRQQAPERAVEPGEAEQPESGFEHEEVPQEDPVRDPAEEPDRRLTEEPAREPVGPRPDERGDQAPGDEEEEQVLGENLGPGGRFERPGTSDRGAGDPEQHGRDGPGRRGGEGEGTQPARKEVPQLVATVGGLDGGGVDGAEEGGGSGAVGPADQHRQHDTGTEPVEMGGQPERRDVLERRVRRVDVPVPEQADQDDADAEGQLTPGSRPGGSAAEAPAEQRDERQEETERGPGGEAPGVFHPDRQPQRLVNLHQQQRNGPVRR